MSEPKRRFFSGDSLQQALVQAANHFNLDPEEIAYRSIEKRHGFLKVRRKVMIEVNPDAPKREAGSPRPAPAPPPPSAPPPVLSPAPAAPAAPVAAARPAPPAARAEPQEADDDNRGNRIGRDDRSRVPAVPDDRGNRAPGARSAAPAPGPRGDRPDRRGDRGGDRGGRGEGRREDPRRRRPAAPRYAREDRAPEAGAVPGGDLVALPDTPRRPSERFPEATGPMAEAASRGVELLLRIAGLELTPRILQGEDRLEVDLSGPDVDWCFADDGELVMAVEHLLPRLIRTLSGESTLVRVDCDNFQEIREERLRSLAQQVAEEVRRRGKSRTLEPMNPADRRIVHMTLADDPGVVTESEGDGYFKRINVRPA